MRVAYLAVMLLGLLALSCASRPLPHHPQPEDGRRAELSRASYALLGAVSDASPSRVAAYFAPEWYATHPDAPPGALARPDAPLWFEKHLAAPSEELRRLEQCLGSGTLQVITRYDIRSGNAKLPDGFGAYADALTRANALVLLTFSPTTACSAPPDGHLLLLWEKPRAEWLVTHLVWLPSPGQPIQGVNASPHEE